MPADPLVSIIIPVYNGEQFVAEAVDSALGQGYPRIEVVVVDDGSEDGTASILKRYSDARLRLELRPHKGQASARNWGVECSQGSHLAFLDADDIFPTNRTEVLIEVLLAHPELEAAFGLTREFVSLNGPVSQSRLRKAVANSAAHSPAAMLIHRRSFLRVGGFSTKLNVGSGLDWWARAHGLGISSRMLDAVVLKRRLHSANNGLIHADSRSQYAEVLKAKLDRHRARKGT